MKFSFYLLFCGLVVHYGAAISHNTKFTVRFTMNSIYMCTYCIVTCMFIFFIQNVKLQNYNILLGKKTWVPAGQLNFLEHMCSIICADLVRRDDKTSFKKSYFYMPSISQRNDCNAFTSHLRIPDQQAGCNIYTYVNYVHSPSGMTEPVFVKGFDSKRKSLLVFRILLTKMNKSGYLPTQDEILRQNIGKGQGTVNSLYESFHISIWMRTRITGYEAVCSWTRWHCLVYFCHV